MLSTSLTTQNIAAANIVYELLSIAGSKSVRSVAGRNAGEPKTLTISHQTVARGKDANGKPIVADRHLIRTDSTEVDASGDSRTGSCQIVIEVPRGDAQFDMVYVRNLFYEIFFTFQENSWANFIKVLGNEP